MTHIRVGVYRFRSEVAGEAIRRIDAEAGPMVRGLPGFVRYTGVGVGDDTLVSLSAWATAEQAEAALGVMNAWAAANMAPNIVESRVWTGEVVFDHRSE